MWFYHLPLKCMTSGNLEQYSDDCWWFLIYICFSLIQMQSHMRFDSCSTFTYMSTGGVICMCLSSFMTFTVLIYRACKYDTVSCLFEAAYWSTKTCIVSPQLDLKWNACIGAGVFKSTSFPCLFFTCGIHCLPLLTLLGGWTQRKRRIAKVTLCSRLALIIQFVIVFGDKRLLSAKLVHWWQCEREREKVRVSQHWSPLTTQWCEQNDGRRKKLRGNRRRPEKPTILFTSFLQSKHLERASNLHSCFHKLI